MVITPRGGKPLYVGEQAGNCSVQVEEHCLVAYPAHYSLPLPDLMFWYIGSCITKRAFLHLNFFFASMQTNMFAILAEDLSFFSFYTDRGIATTRIVKAFDLSPKDTNCFCVLFFNIFIHCPDSPKEVER